MWLNQRSVLNQIKTLIHKEFLLEKRSKFALGGILLYVISTIFVAYLAFQRVIDTHTWNALFWIINLFAATTAVSKSFVQEQSNRLRYLYSLASPQAIIISKITYHAILVAFVSLLAFVFYALVLGNPVSDLSTFFIALLLGSVGFSSTLTLMSAIAAQSNNNMALVSILSFPVLLPLFLSLIKLSAFAIDGQPFDITGKYILILAALNVIIITLALVLFPYLWRD